MTPPTWKAMPKSTAAIATSKSVGRGFRLKHPSNMLHPHVPPCTETWQCAIGCHLEPHHAPRHLHKAYAGRMATTQLAMPPWCEHAQSTPTPPPQRHHTDQRYRRRGEEGQNQLEKPPTTTTVAPAVTSVVLGCRRHRVEPAAGPHRRSRAPPCRRGRPSKDSWSQVVGPMATTAGNCMDQPVKRGSEPPARDSRDYQGGSGHRPWPRHQEEGRR